MFPQWLADHIDELRKRALAEAFRSAPPCCSGLARLTPAHNKAQTRAVHFTLTPREHTGKRHLRDERIYLSLSFMRTGL